MRDEISGAGAQLECTAVFVDITVFVNHSTIAAVGRTVRSYQSIASANAAASVATATAAAAAAIAVAAASLSAALIAAALAPAALAAATLAATDVVQQRVLRGGRRIL